MKHGGRGAKATFFRKQLVQAPPEARSFSFLEKVEQTLADRQQSESGPGNNAPVLRSRISAMSSSNVSRFAATSRPNRRNRRRSLRAVSRSCSAARLSKMALPSTQAAVTAQIKTRLAGHVQLSKNEERATTRRVKTRSGYQISGATACVRRATKKIS